MNLYNKIDFYGYKSPTNFTVQNISERNSIPNEIRAIGITCYVIDEDRTYRLKDGITNSYWQSETVIILPATADQLGGVKIGENINVEADGTISVDFTQGPAGEDGKDGIDGQDGADGANGLSAYELAVQEGFEGTLQDWLNSLKGQDGIDGQDGTNGEDGKDGIDGTNGIDGVDGKSAFEIAVDNGFIGDEEAWLESLKGADGTNGIDGQDGTNGTDGVDGQDGKSAYEIWLDEGNTGTEQDFLDSLKGDPGEQGIPGNDGNDGAPGADGQPGQDGKDGIDGENGLSAYELAIEEGFEGTLQEWLESLKGADGQDGRDGIDGQDGAPGADGQTGPQGPPGDPADTNVRTNNFTITVSQWSTSTAHLGYGYEAYINISGLTTNDTAHVIFDVPSVIIANEAGVLSSAEITTNNIRLFAISIPALDLRGTYVTIKEV